MVVLLAREDGVGWAFALKGGGEGEKLVAHAAIACLDSAALRGSEVLGDVKGCEVLDDAAEALDLVFELEDAWGQRFLPGRIVADGTRGRAQQLGALALGGAAIGVQEPQGLAGTQSMPLACAQQRFLVVRRKCGEGMRNGGPHRAGGEPLLDSWAQARADGQSRCHPGALVAKEPPDGVHRQTLILE
jgi:hypothetical protein